LGFVVIYLFMKRYFKKDVCLPTEVN
jgi:hypothetical protein